MQLIHELADYERSPGSVEVDAPHVRAALFADSPAVFAHVAERGRRGSWAWPSGSSTSPRGRAGTASTSRTSSCSPRPVTAASDGRWWPNWPPLADASGYRQHRLVGAHLERDGPALLPLAGCGTHGRMDRLPPGRGPDPAAAAGRRPSSAAPGRVRTRPAATGAERGRRAQMVNARLVDQSACRADGHPSMTTPSSRRPVRHAVHPVSRRNSATGMRQADRGRPVERVDHGGPTVAPPPRTCAATGPSRSMAGPGTVGHARPPPDDVAQPGLHLVQGGDRSANRPSEVPRRRPGCRARACSSRSGGSA